MDPFTFRVHGDHCSAISSCNRRKFSFWCH